MSQPVEQPPPKQLIEEVLCPLCGYDLRGTTKPRCPECGLQFEWEVLRDPARRPHPYLFEHHPEKNVWSFGATLLANLRPRRFWTTLAPTQPSNPWRLMLYWMLTMLPIVVAAASACIMSGIGLQRFSVASRPFYTVSLNGPLGAAERDRLAHAGITVNQALDQHFPLFPSGQFFRTIRFAPPIPFLRTTLTAWLVWPWVTLAVMLILRQSRRRARIRLIHILRCVIYSGDLVFWLGLIPLASLFVFRKTILLFPVAWSFPLIVVMTLGIWCPLLLVVPYRLIIAYRRYLNFPHPVSVVLLTQFLVAILVLMICGFSQAFG